MLISLKISCLTAPVACRLSNGSYGLYAVEEWAAALLCLKLLSMLRTLTNSPVTLYMAFYLLSGNLSQTIYSWRVGGLYGLYGASAVALLLFS